MLTAVSGTVSLAFWGTSRSADADMYLDPISVLFWAASLNFRGVGTKLDITANRISFDAAGIAQGSWRAFKGFTRAVGGASSGASFTALPNLTPAIFEGLKRLDPIQNPSTRLLCILAWRGFTCWLKTTRELETRWRLGI